MAIAQNRNDIGANAASDVSTVKSYRKQDTR